MPDLNRIYGAVLRRNGRHSLLPWIIPSSALVLWILISEAGMIPTYLLSHPLEIGKAGYLYIFGNPGASPYGGRFLDDTLASLIRVLSGFGVAVAMMGVNRIRGTFAILLPGAMPHIMTGLRLGLGISWAYLVLGELTGVPNGLGAVIMDARMLGRIDIIIVGIIIIAVIGRACDRLLTALMRICFRSARGIG